MGSNTEIYADEIDGVLVGYPVSKVRFVSTNSINNEGQPVSETVLMLAIPTDALIAGCKTIINNAEGEITDLIALAEASTNRLKETGGKPIAKEKS